MYRLQVFHPGKAIPAHTEEHPRAADVLTRIPLLLAEHAECETILVTLGPTRLFSVDCKGNSTAG